MKCAFVKDLRMPLAAAFAFAAFQAQAADLYAPGVSTKDAPMYDMGPNWTGFYLGVNGGYGWDAASSTLTASAFETLDSAAGTASAKLSPGGWFGGGQLGYNLQRDRLVFGVEADFQGAGIVGSTATEALSQGGNLVTDAWAKSRLDWFGTLRARAGYAFGGSLLYATGGFAFGGVRDSLSWTITNGGNSLGDSAGRNTTLTGYTVGGGLETAVTPSWSIKAEYQYINLGADSLSGSDSACGLILNNCQDAGGASAKFDHTYQTFRLGLNYKINQVYEPLK